MSESDWIMKSMSSKAIRWDFNVQAELLMMKESFNKVLFHGASGDQSF
jgi:hypothetical protein